MQPGPDYRPLPTACHHLVIQPSPSCLLGSTTHHSPPPNRFRNRQGHIKLIDFGLSSHRVPSANANAGGGGSVLDDDGTGTYVSKGSDGGDQSTHNSTFDINN